MLCPISYVSTIDTTRTILPIDRKLYTRTLGLYNTSLSLSDAMQEKTVRQCEY